MKVPDDGVKRNQTELKGLMDVHGSESRVVRMAFKWENIADVVHVGGVVNH